MKNTQNPHVSQNSNSIKNLKKVLSVSLVLLAIVVSCSKEETPTPTPPPTPITKTVVNTITETQTPLATVNGEIGETKSIARYQGTALSGDNLVATYTVNGDTFTATEHTNYPQDSLVLTFNKTGAGSLLQKLVSPQKVENKDSNGDGVLDKITFTSTEKERITAVNAELVAEEVVNTITITNTAEIPATFEGVIGQTYELPKLTGTAEIGEVVYNLSTNNDSLIEWLDSTDETKLKFKFLEDGEIIITQIISSSDQTIIVDTDNNGEYDLQKNYIGQQVEAITELKSILPEEAVNTITITNTAEIPATFEGTITKIYEIPKLTGTAEVGEVVYNLSTNNDSLIEWLDSTDETIVRFKVLAIGSVAITQTISSSDQTELLDTTGDGLVDKQINYTGEIKESLTNLEGVDIEFGLNVEGIATLQEYFNGKIIEMKEGEMKHVDYTELLNIPEGKNFNSISLIIEPKGIIGYEFTDNGQVTTGLNFMLKNDYRDTDLKIIFAASIAGEDPLEVELLVPRGVSLDTSDPIQVKADIKEKYLDLFARLEGGQAAEYVYKWFGQSPTIYLHGATAEHRVLLDKAIADINNILAEAGAVKEDGSPFRIEIVDTQAESNTAFSFGDVDWFNNLFGTNITGDGGRASRKLKPGTQEIIGGGCYERVGWGGGTQGEVAGIIQEFLHVLGMGGETDEDPSSISTILGYNIIANLKDKGALEMFYNGHVPLEQRVAPGRVVNSLPLIDNLLEEVFQRIIDESDSL